MDEVIEHFLQHLNPNCEIVDHRIIEHEKHSFTSPRKEVEVTIKDKESGKTETFRYNYNKILKEIKNA